MVRTIHPLFDAPGEVDPIHLKAEIMMLAGSALHYREPPGGPEQLKSDQAAGHRWPCELCCRAHIPGEINFYSIPLYSPVR
jgi:hypothetical protein